MGTKETISRPIAPEEVRVGMYIAVLHVVAERVPGCWCDVSAFEKLEARRFVRLPLEPSEPLEVMEVCLPFVLVKEPRGCMRTLDVRRCRFAELSRRYGRRVFGMLREASKARRDLNQTTAEDE